MSEPKLSPDIKPATLVAAQRASDKLRETLLSMFEPGFYGEMHLKVSVRNGNITTFEVDRKESCKVGD